MSNEEHDDLWKAISELTKAGFENAKDIALLVQLSQQQPAARQVCVKRIDALDAEVGTLKTARDKALGGWGVLHWLLTGGFLAVTGAAITLSVYIREILQVAEQNHAMLMNLPK